MKWLRVNQKQPCPVCRKTDWCGYSDDGHLAICMRVPSSKQTRNGGYMHRLKEDFPPPIPIRSRPAHKPSPAILDRWNTLKRTTHPEALEGLAESLGVSVAALIDLRAARAESHGVWAFPMCDGNRKVVGIRLRSEDGRKWAVRGSREGLFYPDRAPDDHVAIVCEGPTDTAAALTLGLWAVGRPSCMGGVDHLKTLFRRLLVRHVIIVGDNDPPKPRPQGGHWQPGIDGARRLMTALKLPCKLLIPPAKDIRAWVQAGATREDFDSLTNQQNWRQL